MSLALFQDFLSLGMRGPTEGAKVSSRYLSLWRRIDIRVESGSSWDPAKDHKGLRGDNSGETRGICKVVQAILNENKVAR